MWGESPQASAVGLIALGLKWNILVLSSGWHEDSVPIPSVSEPQAGAQTSQDDRDIAAALERRPRPQEEALGGGAALHLVQRAVLDSHRGEAGGPAVGGTLLAGRTGDSQTPRQGLQGVLRAPGGISKVQEVLLVWLVHLSQAYNGSEKPDAIRRRLFLSKVGNVKAVFHRRTPRGKVKTCTVVREPNGEWHASLVYEDDEVAQPSTKPASPVGIDLGLKSLVTTTDGVKIPHPRFLRKAEGRLNRLQRSFSRTRKPGR